MVGRFFGSALLSGAKAAYLALASLGGLLGFLLLTWVGHTWATNIAAPAVHFTFVTLFWQVVTLLVNARLLFALIGVTGLVLAILTALRGGRLSVSTGLLLGICAICAAALDAISMLTTGHLAMYSIILVGFFNSIMFPSIFTLGVAELGPHTGDGSGIMIMSIVGGAIIPVAQGAIADRIGIHHAFILPIVCYLYIVFYAFKGSKPTVTA